ncbi:MULTISPECIES: hypothetical protein [Pseudomonas]|jgi:hypothetical protein|uniref:hypothetical protein n=1 Tax=unclassified Pseudomonas TaxID=196821 RepID=UPI0018E7B40A|nr:MULTISPECIES: hypothetical protein [unclassified Pseudomonas]
MVKPLKLHDCFGHFLDACEAVQIDVQNQGRTVVAQAIDRYTAHLAPAYPWKLRENVVGTGQPISQSFPSGAFRKT